MNATLLVLAAGMASRYGSLKQIDRFGPSGESIIDYSVYDAIEAGFTKVVFVIRKEFASEFREIFEPRFEHKIRIGYAFQELSAFTRGFSIPDERTKPWGTAHAVICSKDLIYEPFAVINADDFYGKEAFSKAYHFLTGEASPVLWANICYELKNTLSEHGPVSRGICESDENNNIQSIVERIHVHRENNHVVFEENGHLQVLSDRVKASMNFWCFTPEIFEFAMNLFHGFLVRHSKELKSEFFIPLVGDEFIRQGRGQIKAVTTSAQWFGVTYKEEKALVQKCISRLIEQKIYPPNLWQTESAYNLS